MAPRRRRTWALLFAVVCSACRSSERSPRDDVPAAAGGTAGAGGSESAAGSASDASFPLPQGLRITALAVNASSLYFLAGDTLYRMPKEGGEPTRLAHANEWVHGLAFAGGLVHFVDGKSVARFDEARAVVEPLHELSGDSRIWSLAASDKTLAVVTPGCAQITALAADGTLLKTITQAVGDSVGGAIPAALGADYVYCSGGIGGPSSSTIFRYRPPDGALEPLVDLGPVDDMGYAPEAPALLELGDQLYYARGFGVARRLMRLEAVPLAGGTPTVLGERKAIAPHDLRYSEPQAALYFMSVSEPALVKYSLATGALSAKSLTGLPYSTLANDERYLYFAREGALERSVLF